MKRNFFKKAATVVAAMTLTAGLGMTCAWANYTPENFEMTLYFEDGDPYAYTPSQRKDNDSYGIVYYKSGPLGFEAAMIGGDYETDFRLFSYYLEPGQSTWLTNYVYESGYRNARLRGESCYDVIYSVYGSWAANLN